jgi:hypothetical protein
MARSVLKRSTVILVVACASAGALACATTEVQQDKYPRRPSGCDIALYHTSVPGAAAWDDLGIAEVACHVSSPLSQCLQMLKAEGCRLGGDMIYNIPRSPLRPQDQVMVFRGQVAHTRGGGPPKKDDDADLPPPATAAEAAQPVVPLTGPAAPKAP